ncbi:phytoene desaturase family protein [Luteipulveratus flavus]|uniref:Phytoene desaturase family protein n=1 Tax=Luteipulveratus flavus TaxID=3031728 RepID=A0ABT6C7G5_9MICO|nr:phytoene desaturase family protein [Luteipulveratus sp. YIM 133296]MDF8264847.1 phytoene desaturase family protein [Luteipulveratus sp. YIM 133296]
MPARPTAVVIGGGVAGLASAALLARDGHDVELHEQNSVLGGRAGRWNRDGFRFDTGPSWYLMADVFDHFFRLLGTTTQDQLDLVRLDPAYRVFFEGDPSPMDVRSDPAAVAAAFERVEPGAGTALTAYLASARETYDLAVRRFLYTTYASMLPLARPDVLRRLGRLARLLGQPLDRFAGRYVHDHRLAQVLGYPAVFLGTSPSRAPSMYHLMSHLDLVEGVFYPQGGFARLVDSLAALAEAEGVRIHTGSTATQIVTAPRAARPLRGDRRTAQVRGVRVHDAEGQERTVPADVVVGATDLHHVETRLLPEPLRSRPESWWRRRDPGPGAVLVLLGVRGSLPQLAHHSLLFTREWERHFDVLAGSGDPVPDPASIYVSRTSATDSDAAPPDHENLFVLVPVPADPALGRGGLDGDGDPQVERVADAAVRQIASWAGVPDLAERIVVRRTIGPGDFVADLNAWAGGALGLAHTLRQSAFLRGRNTSRTVDGLYYAGHGTIPGIGLPMCLISAEVLLKAVRGDRSTERLSEPLPARRPSPAGTGGGAR